MATPAKRPTSISPLVTARGSNYNASSSSSANPSELSSPSSYFLPELVPLVASRLTSLQDFFNLRAACRTYRAVLTPSPSNLASHAPLNLASQAPLTNVPHKAFASESLLGRLLRFCLPCTRPDRRDPCTRTDRTLSTRFYAFGCRVAIDDLIKGSHRYRELRIRHLITGEQARLPNLPEDINGVIFSGDLVVTFKGFRPELYYCRIGDVHWRHALCDEGYKFHSLTFVKGTLYGLIRRKPAYRLAVVEVRNNSAALSFLGAELVPHSVRYCLHLWLAACRDELLLVAPVQHSPLVLHVFRWHSGETKWARITSLGGCSLFFHIRQFAGCVGPDHPAVPRDCMYFTGSSGRRCEFRLVDGSWHKHVADYPGRVAMEDYAPLAWLLESIG